VSRNPENTVLGVYLRPAGDEGDEGTAEAESDNDDGEEEDEGERGSRDIARNDVRAIESGALQGEESIARSREEDEEDHSEDDEPEEEVDHIEELSHLGWYRAQTAFAAEDVPEDHFEDEDPVARRLRHDVGIYRGRNYEWKTPFYRFESPWVGSAEEFFELGPEERTEGEESSSEWPASPEQMAVRLERVIPLLQSKPRQFWDVGFSDWYAAMQLDHPRDMEKVCKPAYLHAERWRNEHTGEELWALVALQDAWGVPDDAIEQAVLRRVAAGPRTAEENESDAPREEEGPFEF
jgi:hypothetical protein